MILARYKRFMRRHKTWGTRPRRLADKSTLRADNSRIRQLGQKEAHSIIDINP